MVTQPTTVLPPQPRKCGGVHTPQVQKLLTGHKSWKSYCATTEGLVSSSCEGVVLDGAQCCASCFALLKDKALQKRIKRQPRMRYLATTNQSNLDITISKVTRHDYVTHNQLLQRSQHLGQQRRQDFFTVRKHIRVADKATRDWKIAKVVEFCKHWKWCQIFAILQPCRRNKHIPKGSATGHIARHWQILNIGQAEVQLDVSQLLRHVA